MNDLLQTPIGYSVNPYARTANTSRGLYTQDKRPLQASLRQIGRHRIKKLVDFTFIKPQIIFSFNQYQIHENTVLRSCTLSGM